MSSLPSARVTQCWWCSVVLQYRNQNYASADISHVQSPIVDYNKSNHPKSQLNQVIPSKLWQNVFATPVKSCSVDPVPTHVCCHKSLQWWLQDCVSTAFWTLRRTQCDNVKRILHWMNMIWRSTGWCPIPILYLETHIAFPDMGLGRQLARLQAKVVDWGPKTSLYSLGSINAWSNPALIKTSPLTIPHF